jgi:hypothetical protein
MIEMKKLIVDVPLKLHEKMDRTKVVQMITKSTIAKLAINKYCDEVLSNVKSRA